MIPTFQCHRKAFATNFGKGEKKIIQDSRTNTAGILLQQTATRATRQKKIGFRIAHLSHIDSDFEKARFVGIRCCLEVSGLQGSSAETRKCSTTDAKVLPEQTATTKMTDSPRPQIGDSTIASLVVGTREPFSNRISL